MKHFLLLLFVVLPFIANAQYKESYYLDLYDGIATVEGTDYVIVLGGGLEKKFYIENHKYLLFLNTRTGKSNTLQVPNEGYFTRVAQVKIDSLGINLLLLLAKSAGRNQGISRETEK